MTSQFETENALLKRELASRAIRTMGPRSPFWNCTVCGAAHLSPLDFKHKPGCLLCDTPNPVALWPEGSGAQWPMICAAPRMLLALTELLKQYVDLINCGDCGHWDPEKEQAVIGARAAIAQAEIAS